MNFGIKRKIFDIVTLLCLLGLVGYVWSSEDIGGGALVTVFLGLATLVLSMKQGHEDKERYEEQQERYRKQQEKEERPIFVFEPGQSWENEGRGTHSSTVAIVNRGAKIRDIEIKAYGQMEASIATSKVLGAEEKTSISIDNYPNPMESQENILLELNYKTLSDKGYCQFMQFDPVNNRIELDGLPLNQPAA